MSTLYSFFFISFYSFVLLGSVFICILGGGDVKVKKLIFIAFFFPEKVVLRKCVCADFIAVMTVGAGIEGRG